MAGTLNATVRMTRVKVDRVKTTRTLPNVVRMTRVFVRRVYR